MQARPPDDLFHRNAALLHESLQQRLFALDAADIDAHVEIVRTDGGFPACICRHNGEPYRINSRDPLRQAGIWCDNIPFADIKALFVYGCGFGYPIAELFRRKANETIVLVFEHDIRLFAAMLRHVDLAPLLRTNKLAFFVGDYEEFAGEFKRILSSEVFFGITAPSVAMTPDSRRHRGEYTALHRQLIEQFILQVNKLGNDHADTLAGFRHNIANVRTVLENPYLSVLKDKYRNVPAFIISNGPSLDRNIRELQRAKGKGLLLSTDSAITTLMRNGIVPDAICVLERTPGTYHWHFEHTEYPEEVVLLAATVADPRIFASFRGAKLPIFRNSDSNSPFVNKLVGDGSALFGGKSVAHLAFEAAVYMGANPIVLVGQDLAYGEDGATHSRQSVYADDKLKSYVDDKIKSQQIVYVESEKGGLLASNAMWVRFKTIFEQMIAEHPSRTVFNCTEGGAKIAGASGAKLSDAVSRFCIDPLPIPLHALWKENKEKVDLPARYEKRRGIVAELDSFADVYGCLKQLAVQRKAVCERFVERLSREAEAETLQKARMLYDQHISELLTKFLNPHVHAVFFQQAILAGLHRMNELGPQLLSYRLAKGFRFQFDLFDQLEVICDSLDRNFAIAADELRRFDGAGP
ncbi:MAG: motility associated factor glycosyltransferase family protein [Paenibacillaceae bacterium]|nr:motility associated factor glycosyltransferase family protein [Paenibacillaceae bacterium]